MAELTNAVVAGVLSLELTFGVVSDSFELTASALIVRTPALERVASPDTTTAAGRLKLLPRMMRPEAMSPIFSSKTALDIILSAVTDSD